MIKAYLAAIAIVAAFVAVVEPIDGQAHPPNAYVVSYLVSASRDSNDWVPWWTLPIHRMPPHPWEWRVYDPRTGRDRLFLKLSSYPLLTRWDSTYQSVEFIQGDEIQQAPWRFGAVPRVLAKVPTDSCLCDFWSDAAGGMHLVDQREVVIRSESTVVWAAQIGRRWDLANRSRPWQVTVVDSSAGGHYGECYVTPKLEAGVPRPKQFRLAELLMFGVGERYTTLSTGADGRDLLWVPSQMDSALGLEIGATEGDTYHATEPVVWVDRARNRRRVILPWNEADTPDQLGFAERDGKVLLATEIEGGSPTVLDLRSGEVRFRVDRVSAGAVWVPTPRP
ncbi:MAG TPA: hypothetical protein VFP58_12200 [Candidatus Eisenbacteria bacterium]|nr:hypothetical protein [Candidatus Eisenbacteria bacterium]